MVTHRAERGVVPRRIVEMQMRIDDHRRCSAPPRGQSPALKRQPSSGTLKSVPCVI
jgi:hypothetical protein